jgi:hypothetical protein
MNRSNSAAKCSASRDLAVGQALGGQADDLARMITG